MQLFKKTGQVNSLSTGKQTDIEGAQVQDKPMPLPFDQIFCKEETLISKVQQNVLVV